MSVTRRLLGMQPKLRRTSGSGSLSPRHQVAASQGRRGTQNQKGHLQLEFHCLFPPYVYGSVGLASIASTAEPQSFAHCPSAMSRAVRSCLACTSSVRPPNGTDKRGPLAPQGLHVSAQCTDTLSFPTASVNHPTPRVDPQVPARHPSGIERRDSGDSPRICHLQDRVPFPLSRFHCPFPTVSVDAARPCPHCRLRTDTAKSSLKSAVCHRSPAVLNRCRHLVRQARSRDPAGLVSYLKSIPGESFTRNRSPSRTIDLGRGSFSIRRSFRRWLIQDGTGSYKSWPDWNKWTVKVPFSCQSSQFTRSRKASRCCKTRLPRQRRPRLKSG